jgi:hypothetical protein
MWNTNKDVVIFHSGELGKLGSFEEREADSVLIAKEIEHRKSEGYQEVDSEYGWQWLIINYGRVYSEDLEDMEARKEKLRINLNKILLNTGLGYVSSVFGLLGEDLEIWCNVYDCFLAQDVVEEEKKLSNLDEYECLRVSEYYK